MLFWSLADFCTFFCFMQSYNNFFQLCANKPFELNGIKCLLPAMLHLKLMLGFNDLSKFCNEKDFDLIVEETINNKRSTRSVK